MGRLAGTLLLALMLATAPAAAQAAAPTISKIRFGGDPARTRVVVESDRPLDYFIFTLAQQGARIVIDFEHVAFALEGEAIGAGQRRGAGQGLVAAYRFADFSPERSRIVLDLAAPAAVTRQFLLPAEEGGGLHRLVIDLEPTSAERFASTAGYPDDRVREPPARAPDPPAGRVVVVLDPGHGGDQPGAIGAKGAQEKDVSLALALAVRERLEATGRYEVVMTRSDDRRVELEDRVRIARDAGADLFLSIHADAGDDTSLRGASVYTLADAAEARSRSEILGEDPHLLDVSLEQRSAEVGEILYDLVHRNTKSQSTAFAEALIPPLRAAGPLLRNTHRSAGYYVLLAPDVPAVLLEAGFITNAQDEARLTTAAERNSIAEAVVEGVESYFDERERLYAGR
jgi:N-acetylmuramoyl-L-alanine amidase